MRIEDFVRAAHELAAEVLRWSEAGMNDEDIDAVLADHNLHFQTMALRRIAREMRMELKRDAMPKRETPVSDVSRREVCEAANASAGAGG